MTTTFDPHAAIKVALLDVLDTLHNDTLDESVVCNGTFDEDEFIERFAPEQRHPNLCVVTLFTQEDKECYADFNIRFVALRTTMKLLREVNPVIDFGRFNDEYSIKRTWNQCEFSIDDCYWQVLTLGNKEALPKFIADGLQHEQDHPRKKGRSE